MLATRWRSAAASAAAKAARVWLDNDVLGYPSAAWSKQSLAGGVPDTTCRSSSATPVRFVTHRARPANQLGVGRYMTYDLGKDY